MEGTVIDKALIRGGMHQPFPDPTDMRLLDNRSLLIWLCKIQQSLANWPEVCEVYLQQVRPGVIRVSDNEIGEFKVVAGMNALLDHLESVGAIEIEPQRHNGTTSDQCSERP